MMSKKTTQVKIIIFIFVQLLFYLPNSFASWMNRDVAKRYLETRYQQMTSANQPNKSKMLNSIIPFLNKAISQQQKQKNMLEDTVSGLNIAGCNINTKAEMLKKMNYSAAEAAIILISTKGGGHKPETVFKQLIKTGYGQEKVNRFLGNVAKHTQNIEAVNKLSSISQQKQAVQTAQKTQKLSQQKQAVQTAQKTQQVKKEARDNDAVNSAIKKNNNAEKIKMKDKNNKKSEIKTVGITIFDQKKSRAEKATIKNGRDKKTVVKKVIQSAWIKKNQHYKS